MGDGDAMKGVESFEEKRLEIERSLKQAEQENREKQFEESFVVADDNVADAHARAAALSMSSDFKVECNFDESLQIDFSEGETLKGVESFEEKRLEIMRSLKQAEQESKVKQFDESFVVADDLDEIRNLAAANALAAELTISSAKDSELMNFDDSLQINFSEGETLEGIDDFEERRLQIEKDLKQAEQESKEKNFDESFVEADDIAPRKLTRMMSYVEEGENESESKCESDIESDIESEIESDSESESESED